MKLTRSRHTCLLGLLEIATGVGIIIFWVLFFAVGLSPHGPPPCYLQFEHSFILPDAWLAGLLILAGWLLSNGRARGGVLSLPAGGGLVFMGAADASFNSMNGIYVHDVLQAVQNLTLNLWCLAFGLTIVITLSQSIMSEMIVDAVED